MVGNDRQATSFCQHLRGCRQEIAQRSNLIVDLYAQCLEYLRIILNFTVLRSKLFKEIHKIVDFAKRFAFAASYNRLYKPTDVLHIAVVAENTEKVVLRSTVQHIGSSARRLFRHTHIKFSTHPERKTTFCDIKLMRRHAQICQNAVNLINAIVVEVVAQIAIISENKL